MSDKKNCDDCAHVCIYVKLQATILGYGLFSAFFLTRIWCLHWLRRSTSHPTLHHPPPSSVSRTHPLAVCVFSQVYWISVIGIQCVFVQVRTLFLSWKACFFCCFFFVWKWLIAIKPPFPPWLLLLLSYLHGLYLAKSVNLNITHMCKC